MYRDKKKITIIVMMVAVFVMATGYALFNTYITVSGTANIDSNWNVYISNVVVGEKYGTATNLTGSPSFENLTAEMHADFKVPGDWITYEVTITNAGDFDAIINEVTTNETGSAAIIHSTNGIEKDETIPKGTTKTFTVKIEYDPTVTTQPTVLDKTLTLSITCIQDLGGNGGSGGSTTAVVFNKESQSNLTFTSSEDISTFKEVKVDNNVVDSSNYTVTSGSTVVTLKKEYLNSLSAGTHTMDIVSTGATHSASFEVITSKQNTSLVESILNNNEVYADNVRSPYVDSDTGIDFNSSAKIITFEEKKSTTTQEVDMSNFHFFATSYTLDENSGRYILSGETKTDEWSNMSSDYVTYPYSCTVSISLSMSSGTLYCETSLYKISDYVDETTAKVYVYTSEIHSEVNNGNGLYYTSTNTEDNKTTYYFRGDVNNNYVKLGTNYQACTYNGNVIKNNSEITKEVCLATTQVCKVSTNTNEQGYDYYIDQEGWCELVGTVINGTPTYETYDLLWKIVRINEDGSIRLIAAKNVGASEFNLGGSNLSVGYMYGATSNTYEETHTNTKDSIIKTYLDNWYTNNLSNYEVILADAGFCNDRSLTSGGGYGISSATYGAASRLSNVYAPQFACPQDNDLFTTKQSSKGNNALTYSIGLLTADEAVYAGFGDGATYNLNYIFNNSGNEQFWTMSPAKTGKQSMSAGSFRINRFALSNIGLSSLVDFDSYDGSGIVMGVRPVINVKGDSIISLEGTGVPGSATNPYVIK